jgi:Domain of unknown function (DUF5666)
VTTRSNGLAIITVLVGALSLAACGSDRAGTSTAPSAVPSATSAFSPATTSTVFAPRDHGGPGENLSGESTVTSLVSGTSCPTLSFMIGGFKVSVTATTVFERGTCADIVMGARLKVTGTRQPDNSIVATSIEVKTNGRGRNPEHVEGEGIITAVDATTSCPTLTFSIGAKSISVTADTVFQRGTCDDLKIGKRVHVKGEMLDDDVVATTIEVQSDSPGHPVVEGDGRVTSIVSGTCPRLVFMAEEEWKVTLDESTTFVNGTCADIAVGKKVGVKGTVTAEHEVLATKIVFKGSGDDDN